VALEISHPNKLISVTTITPSQNLRYAIYSLATSSSDMSDSGCEHSTSRTRMPTGRWYGGHCSSFLYCEVAERHAAQARRAFRRRLEQRVRGLPQTAPFLLMILRR